jgi:alkylation response protein AidB-like acyl-CoA dehydrogenase
VGESDGGLAWATVLYNVGAWYASIQNEQLQNDIYGTDPEALNVGIIAPSTVAIPVEGGYRVSGKGFYASGSLNATWVGNGALVKDEQGNTTGSISVFAPREEVEIEDTWFVTGMRASGSNCIIWDDVFVPSHHTFDPGKAAASHDYDTPFKDEVLYRSAFSSTLALVLIGPQLGIARSALAFVIEQAKKKGIAYTTFGLQKDSAVLQQRIARAATQIEAAHVMAYDAADRIDRWAREGHVPDMNERAQIRATTSFVAESVTGALDSLITAHGSGGFALKSPLQRYWRDSNVGARHAFVLPDIAFESYGKTLLGVEDAIAPIL